MQYFLLIPALAAIASASFYSSEAHQSPLSHLAEPQPFDYPASNSQYIRCTSDKHWACAYYRGTAYCACVFNKDPEINDHTSAKTKDIASFEVISELQPGNNDTLVSLYNMWCEPYERVGCHLTLGKIMCGCLPDFDLAEGGEGCDGSHKAEREHLRKEEEAVADELKLRAEKRETYEQQVDDEVREGPLVADAARDFRFNRVQWPRCNKPGYHIKCCLEGRKSVCFCAGTGTRCTPQ